MLDRLIFLRTIRLLFILSLVIALTTSMVYGDTNLDLMNASQAGNVSNVQNALNSGANINTELSNGVTPLLMASQFGHIAIIKLLLDEGANIDAKNDEGITPLMMASHMGYTAVVKLLLEKGADVNAKNVNGITSLWTASQKDFIDIVKLLLENGADVDAKDAEDTTPLSIASLNDNPEVVKLLLAKGANVNAKRTDGISSLFITSQEGYTEIVKLLLDYGANVDEKGFKRITPLWVASQQGHTEVVSLLLDNGAEVDAIGTNGLTPIMMASQTDNAEIVKLLLERGADVNRVVTIDGVKNTCVSLAERMGREKIVEILKKAGTKGKEAVVAKSKKTTINYGANCFQFVFQADGKIYTRGRVAIRNGKETDQLPGSVFVVGIESGLEAWGKSFTYRDIIAINAAGQISLANPGTVITIPTEIEMFGHTFKPQTFVVNQDSKFPANPSELFTKKLQSEEFIKSPVPKDVTLKPTVTLHQKAENIFPEFTDNLQGRNPVRVRNPNEFSVVAGIRSGKEGKNLDVPANGIETIYVPNGKYDIYFVYSNKPDALFQGDSFTLNNNGVEIQIVKIVNGNYSIRQVK